MTDLFIGDSPLLVGLSLPHQVGVVEKRTLTKLDCMTGYISPQLLAWET